MYSVSRKNCEKTAAPERSEVTFEPVSVRSRKIRIGKSGAGDRSSMTTNAAINAPLSSSSPIVVGLAQPRCGASTTA